MAGKFNLLTVMTLNAAGYTKGLNTAERATQKFSKDISGGLGSLNKAIGLLGVSFGAFEVAGLIKDSISLAGVAEGVESAFYKIANRTDLSKLRDSVKGTVSDLELMKRAVSAQNFGIPVQQLGLLFEFASKRAQDTGQNVDYLVDSIVTGIGRKSPLILDNLGISAVQLKSKLKGISTEAASVGDVAKAVGEIAAESLSKTGGLLDTTTIKVAAVAAQWSNVKVELGQAINNTGWISSFLGDTSDMLKILGNESSTTLQKMQAMFNREEVPKILKDLEDLEKGVEAVKKFAETINTFGGSIKPFRIYDSKKDIEEYNFFKSYINKPDNSKKDFRVVTDSYTKENKTLTTLNTTLETYNNELKTIDISNTVALLAKIKQISAIEKQIKSINDLKNAESEASKKRIEGIEKEKAASKDLDPLDKRQLNKNLFKEDGSIKGKGDFKPIYAVGDDGIKPEKLKEVAKAQQILFNSSDSVWKNIKDGFINTNELANQTTNAVGGLTDAFTGLFEGAEGGFKNLVTSMLGGVQQIINALLAQSIAAMIAGEAHKGLIGLLTASIGVAAITGLWKSKVPAFATGGIVGGNSFTGDNVNARVNSGEMILNQSQQANLFAMANGSGGSTLDGTVKIAFVNGSLEGYLNHNNKKRNNMK